MKRDPILVEAFKGAGNASRLAVHLNLTRQAVYQWRRVPAELVLKVEALSGVSRSRLRPDLYPEELEKV